MTSSSAFLRLAAAKIRTASSPSAARAAGPPTAAATAQAARVAVSRLRFTRGVGSVKEAVDIVVLSGPAVATRAPGLFVAARRRCIAQL
jgi:hypothetical protein